MAVAKMILCKGNGSPYLNCVGKKSETEFYISRSLFAYFPAELHTQVKGKIATVGKVPYCKDCIKKIFDLYYDGGKNSIEGAVYYTCQKLDIPFIVELYEATMDIYRNEKNKADILNIHKTFIYKYIANLNTNSNKYKEKLDFSYSDSTLSNLTAKIEARELEKKDLDKFKLDWGVQDCAEDYKFLNDTFLRYTNGVVFINNQQEDLYRDLCRDRLALRKINDKRYDGVDTIDKIQGRISKLMATLKTDQFDSSKPKTPSEESFFAKIAQIELTKPADLYKEPKKYEDFNKLQMYERDMVLRPLLNTLCGMRDFNISVEDVEKYNMDDE